MNIGRVRDVVAEIVDNAGSPENAIDDLTFVVVALLAGHLDDFDRAGAEMELGDSQLAERGERLVKMLRARH